MSRLRTIAALGLVIAACNAGSAGSSGEFDGPSALGYVERLGSA
jgi:hypothetical protein